MDNMKVLVTICARGGSKGIPRKNIKPLRGKPLIAYSIEAAIKWGKADRIVVSTDDDEIAGIAEQYGAEVPFKRPIELATDTMGKLPVIRHAVEFCEQDKGCRYDFVVDLDTTAPIRKVSDIEAMLVRMEGGDADIIYSVCKSGKNPYFNMVELDAEGFAHLVKEPGERVLSRQDAPEVYDMNASIYVYNRDFLDVAESVHSGRALVHVMDDISAHDIDRNIDFEFIEYLLDKGVFEFD
jgi:N-acylneuraminate cytidylyltransferase/CMP-N,N'-diacetyllegionaminic acid synthase